MTQASSTTTSQTQATGQAQASDQVSGAAATRSGSASMTIELVDTLEAASLGTKMIMTPDLVVYTLNGDAGFQPYAITSAHTLQGYTLYDAERNQGFTLSREQAQQIYAHRPIVVESMEALPQSAPLGQRAVLLHEPGSTWLWQGIRWTQLSSQPIGGFSPEAKAYKNEEQLQRAN